MPKNMLNPNVYPPEKISEIGRLIMTNTLIEAVFVILFLFLVATKKKYTPIAVVVMVFCELLLFAKGNLLTAPRSVLTIPNWPLSMTTDRYVSVSDVLDFLGPQVYFNHLKVRQPFGGELTDTEVQTYPQLRSEIESLPANLNLTNRVANVSGYSAVVLNSYAQYWQSSFINSVSIESLNDKRLAFLGVKYLISNTLAQKIPDMWIPVSTVAKVSIYSNNQINPRVFFETGNGAVTIESYLPEHIVVTTNNNQLDTLVLTDSYYPGWRAWVDNKPTKIEPYQETFRKIIVPPGKHLIEFRYQPNSVRIGLTITVLSFVVILVLLIWPQNRVSELLFSTGMGKKTQSSA